MPVDHISRRHTWVPEQKLEQANKPRPRWMLVAQANMWRFLMSIGMLLHKLSPPRPRSPDLVRHMPTGHRDNVAQRGGGRVRLLFWVPRAWHGCPAGAAFPLVLNFHGGGFTLGSAGDDARWCAAAADHVGAVVASVDYRRAPEWPFPTAVEDGADALLWLVERAAELRLDVQRIAVTGFSSGANMCFTVPLRLQEELQNEMAEGEERRESVVMMRRPGLTKSLSRGRVLLLRKSRTGGSAAESGSSSTAVDEDGVEEFEMGGGRGIDETIDGVEEDAPARRRRRRSIADRLVSQGVPISVKGVVAWYPPVDYTRTRAQRRATAKRLDQQLPQIFTDLFDESYLQPPTLAMSDPYLSPGVAPTHMLAGLPDEIVIFGCEWDMLLDEAQQFGDRLTTELKKNVHFHVVPGVPHGFDKAPNPIRQPPAIWQHYLTGFAELRRILEVDEGAK